MTLQNYSIDQIAYQLTDTGQTYFGDRRQSWPGTGARTLTYDSNSNPGALAAFEAALAGWSAVTGIGFVRAQTGQQADIRLVADPQTDAGHTINRVRDFGNKTYIDQASVHISPSILDEAWRSIPSSSGNTQYVVQKGGYGYFVLLHELGHALGLAHPGNYNGLAQYPRDALFRNDSMQMTAMSYFTPQANPHVNADFTYPATPMPADIAAIKVLYGTAQTNPGDTVYTPLPQGTDPAGIISEIDARRSGVTLLDSSGIDRLEAITSGQHSQTIDLAPGGISNIFGGTGNLLIERTSWIENVTTGASRDSITGNSISNHIISGWGNDRVDAAAGHDRILDVAGTDTLLGGTGHDRAVGLSGANTISGGTGNDLVVGGIGRDRLNGGDGNDVLIGEAGRSGIGASDRLFGGAGDDQLTGGAGADMFVFTPNDGADTIAAARSDQAIWTDAGWTAPILGADFIPGYDQISLSGFSAAVQANPLAYLSQSENGARFAAEGTGILFWGVSKADITADDFI